MSNTEEAIVYTIKEVAEKLKVKPQQVYKIVKSGDISPIMVRKAIRISKQELDNYINK